MKGQDMWQTRNHRPQGKDEGAGKTRRTNAAATQKQRRAHKRTDAAEP